MIYFLHKKIFLFVIVASYCLHLLRNLHNFFSIVPVLVSLVAVFFVREKIIKFDRQGLLVLSLFLFSSVLSSLYSFIWYPDESYFMAFGRYFYMLPFLFFLISIDFRVELLVFAFKVFVSFVVLGGVSLFYQTIFGPVSWFPDSSEREGLVRYSSLVGSLTSYGIAGGIALPLALVSFKNVFLRFSIILFISASLLYTLQKVAVVNLCFFVFYLMFFVDCRYKLSIALFVSLFSVVFLFTAYYFEFEYVVATVDNVFRFRENSGSTDVDIISGAVDRLWRLPSRLYQMYGDAGFIFGVGLVAGSGSLGFANYPMSHNGFFDLLFIGGLFNLVVFLLLILFVCYRLLFFRKLFLGRSKEVSDFLSCMLFVVFLLIVNMVFSGIIYIQPYSGVVFYSVVVFSISSLPRLVPKVAISRIGA